MALNKHRVLLGLLGIAALIAVWWVVSGFGLVSSLFLPAPPVVLQAAYENAASLASNLYISLYRLVVGFTIGVVLGICAGIPVGAVKTLQRTALPVVDTIRSIPNLAWIPLALVWFGIGDGSKFFVIALAVFFPVFTNAYVGIKNIDPVLIRASHNFDVPPTKMFYKVLLPAALGDIFVGLKVGLQSGIVAMVATEVVASTSGLGYVMDQAAAFFKSGSVIAVMAIIGILGYGLTQLMVRVEKRYARWHVGLREA